MIGSFTFRPASRDAVSIRLFWDGARRSAVVTMPADVEDALVEASLPANESMDLESALPYGIFVAIKSRCAVNICGDRTVWNDCWGHLRMLN